MKRSTKNWLITAAFLVLIGILAFVGVMSANHWDFSALGTKYETKIFDINEEFENISINSDTADITFLPSDNGKCSVIFYEKTEIQCSASVQDGTLFIEMVDTRKWYDHINITPFSFDSPRITVYLPQAEYASLSIEESTGDIEIPKDFTFESVDISVSTGNVSCFSPASGLINIGASTGDIRVENISAGGLNLSVSTGHVDVHSVTCRGDIGVTVSTGKTTLTNVSCNNVTSSGSTGDITLENVIAAELISIERSTGDIRLEKCDAAELFIKTDTGDVTGALLSEKVFITQSDTGRIEVPETTTGGKCKITTDTGDIMFCIQ